MSLAYSERRRLLDFALARHQATMRGVVLEVGAGRRGRRGRFAPPSAGVARWWMLDVSAAVRPDCVGDVAALPVRSGGVDTAVALEVLEYVADPVAVLGELHRVLAPGGHLVVSVPFIHRIDTGADRWRLSEHGLRRLLAGAGFEPIVLEAQGGLFTAVAHLVCSTVAQRRQRPARWVLGALALPLVGLARLEPRVGWGRTPDATTGYLAIARKAAAAAPAEA